MTKQNEIKMLHVNRILAPIDFSACSRQALDVAIEIAKMQNAQLDVLYVFEELALPSFYGAGAIMMYGKVPNLETEARKAMENLAGAIQTPGVEIVTHILNGHPADEISAFAGAHDTDLIVLATHGLTGLRHVMLGSVAERVVREAPCPVLIVKTHGKPICSTRASTAGHEEPENSHETAPEHTASDGSVAGIKAGFSDGRGPDAAIQRAPSFA